MCSYFHQALFTYNDAWKVNIPLKEKLTKFVCRDFTFNRNNFR